MLPFHKGDRIAPTAGGATLLGFSATVKGSMVEAPEAPRRKGGHLPYAQFVTASVVGQLITPSTVKPAKNDRSRANQLTGEVSE